MSILSTNTRLIKVGQDYSAGSGISIDNHVISVTSIPETTYYAGDNITIVDNVINSKDWSQDIADASANAYNEATAQIPAPFDPSYISAKVDDKLDSMAFTNWQDGQYTTDLQTIEGQINNKLDESAFSAVSGSFLTAINIQESATWNEVSQVYEQSSGTYLTSVSIPESATWQDVSTTVQSNSSQWAEGGTGDEEVNSFVYDNSATINEVNTTYQQNSAKYITAHQSLDGYATEDWVTAQGYITGVDLSEYAKTSSVLDYIDSACSSKLDTTSFSNVSGDFLTTSFAISESANWEEATNAYEQNSGTYLTSISIPESASWNEVSATVNTNSASWGQGGGGGSVPTGLMFESACEYNAVNEISAYNGSAIAQPVLSSLNDASVNNIIVTASLPVTPDANTLYFIPET